MKLIIILASLLIFGCKNPRTIQIYERDNCIEIFCNDGIPSDIEIGGEINGKKINLDRKRTPLFSINFSVFDGIVGK